MVHALCLFLLRRIALVNPEPFGLLPETKPIGNWFKDIAELSYANVVVGLGLPFITAVVAAVVLPIMPKGNIWVLLLLLDIDLIVSILLLNFID